MVRAAVGEDHRSPRRPVHPQEKTRNLDLVTDKRITAARARHDASSGSFSKFGRGTSSPPTCRPASAMLVADGWVTAGP